MPKILVTPQKGLHQTSGQGTMSGQLKEVLKVDALTQTNLPLTLADSGKTIVIGGGNGTIEFPISHTGWHATFVTTGSLVGDVLLSGSTGNAGIDGGEVHILPVIVAGDDAGSGVTAQTFKTITFDQSAENVGDSVIIEVTQGMGTAGAGARSNATPLIGRINATVFTKD